MSTKKELLDKGLLDGDLNKEQLNDLTIPEIKIYADKHGYDYNADSLKKDLIADVYKASQEGDKPTIEELEGQEAPTPHGKVKVVDKQEFANEEVGPAEPNVIESGLNVSDAGSEKINVRKTKPAIDTFSQIKNLFGTLQNNQQGAIYNPVAKEKLKNNVGELAALLTTYLNELNE